MMNAGKQRMVAFYQAAPKRKANDVGVELVPLADASDEFDLTVPPAVKVVYVTHPRDTRKLIPFADYDRRVAEDKLDEALRICTSLGAARIVATATKDDSSRLELNVGKRKVGLRLGGEKSSGLKLEFDVRGSGNKPVDPRPLRYPEEPMFNAVCESVLRLGNQRASIKIVRSSSFGLDGDLAVRLKRGSPD